MPSRFERELRSAHRPRTPAQLGLSRPVVSATQWRRTSRGFYTPTVPIPLSGAQRILDASPRIPPGGALTAWAAAYVHGVDLLDGLDATMRPTPITICSGCDLGRRSGPGLTHIRDRLDPAQIERRFDLPVTEPRRAMIDGARRAPNLVEAVVFLDAGLHALQIPAAELVASLPDWEGRPGVAQLRSALEHADPASASPWETRLRLFYRLRACLPRPLVNRPVRPGGELPRHP